MTRASISSLISDLCDSLLCSYRTGGSTAPHAGPGTQQDLGLVFAELNEWRMVMDRWEAPNPGQLLFRSRFWPELGLEA